MRHVHPEKKKNNLDKCNIVRYNYDTKIKNFLPVVPDFYFIYICTYLYSKFGLRKMTEPRPLYKCTINQRLEPFGEIPYTVPYSSRYCVQIIVLCDILQVIQCQRIHYKLILKVAAYWPQHKTLFCLLEIL
jgi:hypothetical protein